MKPTLTWSHTMLEAFGNCLHKGYRMYIAKDLPREAKSEAQTWGISVHEALSRRVSEGKPLPDTMVQFEPLAAAVQAGVKPLTEEKLGITMDGRGTGFFASDMWGRGALDVLLANTNTAFILDWKTGKRREDATELERFALLLQASRPEITTITGAYVWLQEGAVGMVHQLSDTASVWRSVTNIMKDLNDRAKAGPEFFSKIPNPLCGWCPVKDCEHNRSKA